MRKQYDNLTFDHPNGQITHYNLEVALDENNSPEVVVLRNSELNQGPPIKAIELEVAMGMSGDGKTPHSIYSERDHGRYEHVAFNYRGEDSKGEPIYTKDHSTKVPYLEEAKIQEALDLPEKRRQQALEAEKNKKDFDQGAVKGERSMVSEEELKAYEQQVDKRGAGANNWFAKQGTDTQRPDVSQEELQSLEQQQEQKQNKER